MNKKKVLPGRDPTKTQNPYRGQGENMPADGKYLIGTLVKNIPGMESTKEYSQYGICFKMVAIRKRSILGRITRLNPSTPTRYRIGSLASFSKKNIDEIKEMTAKEAGIT